MKREVREARGTAAREAETLVESLCQQVRSEGRVEVIPVKSKVERTRKATESWRTGVFFVFLALALLSLFGTCSATPQTKKNDCGHPPKILSQAKFSDEDRTKWKGIPIAGKVAIVVSEEGDVTQARMVAASPKEATKALLNAAKQMKFEPRRGCGELKTEIHFSLGDN